MTAFLRAILVLSLLVWTTRASASPSYPAVLSNTLGLPCEPTCALCHVNKPGFATANTLLGRTMRKAGLKCCADASLESVLDEMMRTTPDSDGDGVPDLDELVAGTDPNAEAAELACEVKENYDGLRIFGVTCALHPGEGDGQFTATTLVLLVSLLMVARRRRQKR